MTAIIIKEKIEDTLQPQTKNTLLEYSGQTILRRFSDPLYLALPLAGLVYSFCSPGLIKDISSFP